MTSELKPCPFCGCEPDSPRTNRIEHNSHIAKIECFGCGAVVAFSRTQESEALAIKAVVQVWNRRIQISKECLCAKDLTATASIGAHKPLTNEQVEAIWRLATLNPLHLFIRDIRALLNI